MNVRTNRVMYKRLVQIQMDHIYALAILVIEEMELIAMVGKLVLIEWLIKKINYATIFSYFLYNNFIIV